MYTGSWPRCIHTRHTSTCYTFFLNPVMAHSRPSSSRRLSSGLLCEKKSHRPSISTPLHDTSGKITPPTTVWSICKYPSYLTFNEANPPCQPRPQGIHRMAANAVHEIETNDFMSSNDSMSVGVATLNMRRVIPSSFHLALLDALPQKPVPTTARGVKLFENDHDVW